MELAVDVVEWTRRGLVAHRGANRLSADDALQTDGTHQPRHRAAGNIEAFALQLPPHLAKAVDTEVRLEHASDLILQGGVAPLASRQPGRIDPLCDMGMVGHGAIGNTLQIGSTPCASR
jgi:hypothetical protein